MTRRPSVVQERARHTRARICLAAARVFEARGFAAATLGEIRDELGITNGALYFHFSSKQELAAEIVERHRAVVVAVLRKLDDGDGTALTKLVGATFALTRLLTGDPYVRAGIRLSLEASEGPEFGREAIPTQGWIRWATGHVGQALAAGEIADRLGADMLGRFLVSALIGTHLVSNVLTGHADLEQRIDQMWRVTLPAVLTPDRAGAVGEIIAAGLAAATDVTKQVSGFFSFQD